jgi:hypothetical protein
VGRIGPVLMLAILAALIAAELPGGLGAALVAPEVAVLGEALFFAVSLALLLEFAGFMSALPSIHPPALKVRSPSQWRLSYVRNAKAPLYQLNGKNIGTMIDPCKAMPSGHETCGRSIGTAKRAFGVIPPPPELTPESSTSRAIRRACMSEKDALFSDT